MGLEESPHCPFDVMEACRTGVRRDYHQPGWESSRPTTWPSPIRDWQDDNFERQEQHSGGIGISIAEDKDRRYPAG